MNGWVRSAMVAVLVAVCVSGAFAADEAQMQKMKELGSPGANHKPLEVFAGNWTLKMKCWMASDTDPVESDGTAENSWILGGRFIEQNIKSTMMGQPYEGMGMIGYDNVRAEYLTTWIDNMNTGITRSTSQYDTSTMTFSENGEFACPMTGQKDMKYRGVTKITDNDHISFEMYSPAVSADGKESKMMEIMYERVK